MRPKRASNRSNFLVELVLGWVVVSALSVTINAQSFSKTFTVSPDAGELEVLNQIGAIKITAVASPQGKIVINARQVDRDVRINAEQTSEGKVKVEVKGRGTTDFEITVPPSTKLDLLTYKGGITVVNLTGRVRARITTEGNIQFTGLRSTKVEAHSTSGNVSFSGDILPNGEYSLKSFSGRVDATFPANSDFKLSASSFSGVMDLGGFPMKFDRQTNQLVEASCGTGRAKVYLWTQEGSIYLHRKP